jgi:tetratricopeptide (TPR) repeat protein
MYAGAARAYSLRGSVYRDQAEHDRAIEAYTMAIELDPTDTGLPFWYVSRGWIFYDQGDFDNAQGDLTAAITLGRPDAPEMATAYNLLGLIASEEGNHEEALAHYNMAISIVPDEAVFYYNRAFAFYDLDDYESAIPDLERVLELSEDADLRTEVEEWLRILKQQDGQHATRTIDDL